MSQAAAFPPTTAAPAEAVNLAQVGRAVRKRWGWVVLPALLALGASTLFVNIVAPRYTGEAKLILETRESFYTRPNQDRFEQVPLIDEQAVASQVQVVMSRDLALEAIKQLGLVGNAEFDPEVRGPGPLRQVLKQLGLAPEPVIRAPEERILEKYYERLLVYPVGKSRILAIEFRSQDPELAANAANTIAEMYLNRQEAAKKDTARSASTWLGSNIDALRDRVADAEAKVEAFRARTGLLLGTNNAPIAGQQLTDLATQLSQARTSQADAQAKAALIRDAIKGGRTFEIPDVANNELIRRLIEQRISLRTQLALELRTLGPQHPRIKELQAQLEDLEAQVRGSAERVVRTLENEARIAGSRVESVQAAIDAQKKLVVTANESEPQLRALEREARAQREQLEAYLTRYREATARDTENATPADARIVSRAIVPALPSFPKKLPIMALSTLATIVLALGAIVARELLTAQPAPRLAIAGPVLVAGGTPAPNRDAVAEAAVARALGFEGERVAPAAAAPADLDPEPRPPVSKAPAEQAGTGPQVAVASSTAGALDAEPKPQSAAELPEAEKWVAAGALADEGKAGRPATFPAPTPEAVAATAAALGAGAQDSEPRYDFEALIERLSSQEPEGRGRRILVTGIGRSEPALVMAVDLGTLIASEERSVFVTIDPLAGDFVDGPAGFTDLVAGEAAFTEVIKREKGTDLHVIPAGQVDGATLVEEPQALDIALAALDQTYDWVICGLCDSSDPVLLAMLAERVDAVVIASDEDAADPSLVELYARAKAAGAGDVVVARELAPASAEV